MENRAVARIGIYGDLHLNSKNYGAHRNYPKESLEYLREITRVTRERELTHLIGLGDFSFGRFNTLEYRAIVDRELSEQYNLVNGNRFELKGNHDVAGYGATERDYYISRGLLREPVNFEAGNLSVFMVNYGTTEDELPEIKEREDRINVALAHDFYKFSNTAVANFGKAIDLDYLDKWFGLDILICGHVHKIMQFSGYIFENKEKENNRAHEVKVYYPGCMTRPAYREGLLDEEGQVIILTSYADGRVNIEVEKIALWPLEQSFNLEQKEIEKFNLELKNNRVDISDVVRQLDMHDRNVGNPEDIIASMENIDERYKNKAIELLKQANG